jgi:hypothetical protein
MVAKINAWGLGAAPIECAGCADVAMESTIHRLLPKCRNPLRPSEYFMFGTGGFRLLLSVASHFPARRLIHKNRLFINLLPPTGLCCAFIYAQYENS